MVPIPVILLAALSSGAAYVPVGDMAGTPQWEAATLESGIVGVDPAILEAGSLKRYLVFGPGQSQIPQGALYGASSGGGSFAVALLSEEAASGMAARGYRVIEDVRLEPHDEGPPPDASRVASISGSDRARQDYGVTGNGTTIAIVDTGVDFSNPDMRHSLARDGANRPVMLDPDGQGIVITNATFYAHIDGDGIIRNYTKQLPPNVTSSVYVSRDGVFLDVEQGGAGTELPIYNSFFPLIGDSVVFNGTLADDMKIGNDNRDYIASRSGIYRLGVMYQGAASGPGAGLQVVPVLVVDSAEPGTYDTVIPDMSTSWEDYTRGDLPEGEEPSYDFDFTDERPVILGSGNEFLVYDSDGDGRDDYSAGTLGAAVLDVYGAVSNGTALVDDSVRAVNGTLLPPLDPAGVFFGVMTDFGGHGTSSAATIVSRGQMEYDIYNDTSKYTITGVAPDARIIPVKALWFGDTVYGWLWAAGMDNDGDGWEFSGRPRADIISNSWGVPAFPLLGSPPGHDILSQIMGLLAVPHSVHEDYPGVLMVSSAGNTGHGYGTIGIPSSSPYGISVGAATNNVFVGHGPFQGQPRFGNTTAHSDHIVDFSSRGPTIIGDPKPDLVATGAYGFVPSSVLVSERESDSEPFSLFGGTSMAAPIVSGTAALLMEGMRSESLEWDPATIRTILMSTAQDLGNDPFTQGAGLVDAAAAMDYVHGRGGTFAVHNDGSHKNIAGVLGGPLAAVNYTAIGLGEPGIPPVPVPMTGWFAGHLAPGERTTATFTIKNPTGEAIPVSITPQHVSLIGRTDLAGRTEVRQQELLLDDPDAFIPNYVRLADVKNHTSVGGFFDDSDPVPDGASLMVLNANFAFDDFMNATADMYADDLQISSLYLYDWLDADNDTRVTSDELSMVNRAGSWGTVQEMRVTSPSDRFEGVPLVGIYPVPIRFSYWTGETPRNATSMDYALSASYYKKEPWNVVWPESSEVVVPPNGTYATEITLVVPDGLGTGVYQGFVEFEGPHHTVNAPVSFVSKAPVEGAGTVLRAGGVRSDDVMYGSGYTKGSFDMVNRYMAGDWRQFYLDVAGGGIDAAALELSWEHEDTNLSVFVMDPAGRIVQTNMPAGVFGEFLGWASLDWLGNSPASQGGGFYPVKNKNATSTVLHVPINQTGTYSVLTHATLFGGNRTTEPVTLTGRFIGPLGGQEPVPAAPAPADPAPDGPERDPEEPAAVPAPQGMPAREPRAAAPAGGADPFASGILVGLVAGAAAGVAMALALGRGRQKEAEPAPAWRTAV